MCLRLNCSLSSFLLTLNEVKEDRQYAAASVEQVVSQGTGLRRYDQVTNHDLRPPATLWTLGIARYGACARSMMPVTATTAP
jgi:hypothetical protein